jgi:hypothetical protein
LFTCKAQAAAVRVERGVEVDHVTVSRWITAGHGFVHNLRRGHYELAAEEPPARRVAVAFEELAVAI